MEEVIFCEDYKPIILKVLRNENCHIATTINGIYNLANISNTKLDNSLRALHKYLKKLSNYA